MASIPQADLAWMAAIIDCKGIFTYKRNKSRATPQLVLSVHTADAQITQRLQRLTAVVTESRDPRGPFLQRACKLHCPEPHIHHEEMDLPIITRWAVTGVAAGIILRNLEPYMVRWQDEEVLEFKTDCLANATYSGRGSGMTLEAIRRLMGIGWKLPPEALNKLLPTDVKGGRGHSVLMSCGHRRAPAQLVRGKIWCQPCGEYRFILVERRGKKIDSKV